MKKMSVDIKLSDSAGKILNSPELISIRDNWFERMRRLFNGTDDESEKVFALRGINGYSDDPSLMYKNPELWVAECLESLAKHADESKDTDIFTPLCIQNGVFGVHYIDSIFGCNVYFKHEQWYNDYLDTEVGELTPPDIDKSEAWQLTRRITEAFIKSEVKVPIYSLPTIASVLNIAVNLYGERILTAMLCEPEAAVRDLKIINNTLIELHRRLIAMMPETRQNQLQPIVAAGRTQPPEFGQICGCTTQLISPVCYRDIIAPLDSELLGVYPNGGMIHLCGTHEYHIPLFREMRQLRSVQLNDRAAEGLKEYYDGLRSDQIIYLNPCENMSAEKAVEITGGKRLVLVGLHKINKL